MSQLNQYEESEIAYKIEMCREFYQVIKSQYTRVPKYRKSWIRVASPVHKTGLSSCLDHLRRSNAVAHTHRAGRYKGRICLLPRFLLGQMKYQKGHDEHSNMYALARIMAHEIAHLMTMKHHRSNIFSRIDKDFRETLDIEYLFGRHEKYKPSGIKYNRFIENERKQRTPEELELDWNELASVGGRGGYNKWINSS